MANVEQTFMFLLVRDGLLSLFSLSLFLIIESSMISEACSSLDVCLLKISNKDLQIKTLGHPQDPSEFSGGHTCSGLVIHKLISSYTLYTCSRIKYVRPYFWVKLLPLPSGLTLPLYFVTEIFLTSWSSTRSPSS